MDERGAGLAGGAEIPTSQGSKTSEAERPRKGEARRHCARDLAGIRIIKTSRTCAPVALQAAPGSTVQAAKHQDASAAGPLTCQAEQAKRTAPFSRDWDKRVRVSLHSSTSHETRGVGGKLTSAGTRPGVEPTETSPAATPGAQSVRVLIAGQLVREAGTRTVGACHSEPRLHCDTKRRGEVAHPLLESVGGANVPGACKACMRTCVDREGADECRSCATVPSAVSLLGSILSVFAVCMEVVNPPYHRRPWAQAEVQEYCRDVLPASKELEIRSTELGGPHRRVT